MAWLYRRKAQIDSHFFDEIANGSFRSAKIVWAFEQIFGSNIVKVLELTSHISSIRF